MQSTIGTKCCAYLDRAYQNLTLFMGTTSKAEEEIQQSDPNTTIRSKFNSKSKSKSKPNLRILETALLSCHHNTVVLSMSNVQCLVPISLSHCELLLILLVCYSPSFPLPPLLVLSRPPSLPLCVSLNWPA